MQIEPLQSNELMHFGVLGMKWGKRKQPDKSSFNKRKTFKQMRKDQRILKSKYADEYKNKKKLGKKTTATKNYDNAYSYSMDKTSSALAKKYGKQKYEAFLKNERNKQLMASGALLVGSVLSIAGSLAIRNMTMNKMMEVSSSIRKAQLSDIYKKQQTIQMLYPERFHPELANIGRANIDYFKLK